MEIATQINTINEEAKFDINELFFSITKTDSTILSGNDVFVRISGYTKAELIGSFHNIIRHPDMPRIIFKTLWDYLNANKPVVAYVKNRTKTGEYYWVIAAVFPLKDRYVSIRIKPSSAIFAAAKELYFKLLMAESKNGMEESSKILPGLLSALGYKDYEHFMSDALLKELQGRQSLISKRADTYIQATSPLLSKLSAIYDYSKTIMGEYDRWFEKIDLFVQVKSTFEEKGLLLRHHGRNIVFLSLNASVSSYKVENGGETFGVLAHHIRITAKENDAYIGHIHDIVETLSDLLNAMVFSVSAIRLQIEMVVYSIEESVSNPDNVEMVEMSDNLGDLIELVIENSEKSKTLQLQLDQQIQESIKYLDQMEQQMMYLGYVQTYGIIESAGTADASAQFGVIFSQLKTMIQETSQEVELMQKMGKSFHAENRLLIQKSKAIDILLNHLREETMLIKNLEI